MLYIKGIVHPEFIHPLVFPNLHDFLYYVEKRYSEKGVFFQSVVTKTTLNISNIL